MTNQVAKLSTITIVERLFNFIKDNFDKFGHRKENWWLKHSYGKNRNETGQSWAPFVEAFFVFEGEKNHFEVGHCYGNDEHNVENFIDDIRNSTIKPHYNRNEHPCYPQNTNNADGIDVSWRDIENNLILAFEHSEDSHGGGSTANGQLIEIKDEIEKLSRADADINIIVSRPHIRYSDNKIYQNVVDYFKKDIETILLNINPINEWIIILITPEFHVVNNPINPIKIKFHCYQWNANILEDIPLQKNSFQVKIDNTDLVKKC